MKLLTAIVPVAEHHPSSKWNSRPCRLSTPSTKFSIRILFVFQIRIISISTFQHNTSWLRWVLCAVLSKTKKWRNALIVYSALSDDTLVSPWRRGLAFRTSSIPCFSEVQLPRSALCLIKLPRHSLSNSLCAFFTSASQALPTSVRARYAPGTLFIVGPDFSHSPFRFSTQNALSSLSNFCFG